jgi:Alpha/beta hydrolase domain
MKHRSTLSCTAILVAVLVGTSAASAGAATSPSTTASPTIEPATGGKGGVPSLAATNFDLGSVGYEQSEYLLSGTATAYTSAEPLTSDDKWTVTPASTAPPPTTPRS